MQRPDPLEKHLDCRVEDMTGSEMAAYLKLYLSTRYHLDLPHDGIKERKTMDAFIRRYPNGKAGRILQWVVMHHQGRKDGQYVTTAQFSRAMGWWTDLMYLELQAAEQRSEGTQVGSEALKSMFSGADSMV